MIRTFFRLSMAVLLLGTAGPLLTSCKDKKKTETVETAPTVAPVPSAPVPAPVEISADDSLKTNVVDATKDFPGVTATVNNGEITLTGNIERSRLATLIQSLQSLRPKKINNELTIK